MLLAQATGKEYHDRTKHSYLSVQIDPNYVDPASQPSPFKSYPKFYRRFPLESDNTLHFFIHLTHAVTFRKIYKDGVYKLRVNPSAGALYPTEIYVQIRGVNGLIDGIYHLEVATDSLVLIYELIDDGLESYLLPNRLVKGFIFLVSCVYYRSSWKYKNRSLRYCFLDSGHHLGAIEASAYLHERDLEIIFDFDKVSLNRDLGFENKELVTAGAISGEIKDKSVRQLRYPIPFVCGTDYFEPNYFIEAGYKNTALITSTYRNLNHPQFKFDRERWQETILKRRSMRRFKKNPISQLDFFKILEILKEPIPTKSYEDMEIYLIVNRVEGIEAGLYKYNELIRLGDFSDKAGYLCVNQAIARDSAVTLFFVSGYQNYQTALQIAGLIGQRLYLISKYLELGCSGIGAYYDDETKEFLGTEKDIIYAMAIGR
ncbi:MAG TPA: nitroreductase [Cyanobacteria bacterium UBA11149]|nr:nitroreductase [Cyanobacteria bacterium UBA11367]HBE56930.1 nitroreductase [Cyanobacteria bacterium UBA11366]HBK63574.1 nitroreductase [Cyanobacteria bacterium UBA11166]HBR73443.1 nitroreductase [Cyanobacteria bacterium UBA11159]HBS68712.1 nitroreductase [Cyanobacteria bacterium UBA11153]HBW91888.1 nitroreductase [Cyanobacteria bacterium UBA11149]HCA94537.1 nitroreductase [Cyanobacteria bacterium UBA9226]